MSIADVYDQLLSRWSDIQDMMPLLRETAASYPRPVIIELGVRSGNSTTALLAGTALNGGEVWSCDIDAVSLPPEVASLESWKFRHGDSAGEAILAWMPQEADVIFIDTSHTYEQTIAELEAYVPRLKPGGVMLLHDTQWEPPAISLPEPGGPVTRALNDFCARTGRSWYNVASAEGFYGMGVIHAD